MKRITAAALILLLIFTGGCARKKTYDSEKLNIAFELPAEIEVTESENSAVFMLSERIKVVVIESDATPMIGEDYASSNPTEGLNLMSGAFDANYNNTIYVGKLFEYVLSGSDRGYYTYGAGYTTFAGNTAIGAGFYSQDDDVNGDIYLLVENNICYIICIYIYDRAENLKDYAETVSEFETSFMIKE